MIWFGEIGLPSTKTRVREAVATAPALCEGCCAVPGTASSSVVKPKNTICLTCTSLHLQLACSLQACSVTFQLLTFYMSQARTDAPSNQAFEGRNSKNGLPRSPRTCSQPA